MLAELVHQKDCRNYKIITDMTTGETACSTCGSVSIEKSVYMGTENTGVTKENYLKNARVGRKISLKMADMGLSTIIELKNTDSTGKILSNENRRMFYRLRMWDRNSRHANTTQSFQKAFIILDGIRTKLGLPDSVVEHSAYLFRKIALKKLLGGRSTLGIISATVYIACRETNTPRTLQDVANAANLKRKNLQKIYRFLANELQLHPVSYNPREFVTRISKGVMASEKTERLAFKIISLAEKNGVSASKNPMSIAAAAVYIAVQKNNEKISQTKIANASGITSVTIRDRTKEIKKELGGEI
ncbi:MAG: transcription factor TFIIB [Nitrosopumilus sp.]|nr:transcription factor TFIIB [Nitrosopumilus sp.]